LILLNNASRPTRTSSHASLGSYLTCIYLCELHSILENNFRFEKKEKGRVRVGVWIKVGFFSSSPTCSRQPSTGMSTCLASHLMQRSEPLAQRLHPLPGLQDYCRISRPEVLWVSYMLATWVSDT